MTKRERVKACIRHEQLDGPPWQINYTTALAAQLLHELGLKERVCNVLGVNVLKYGELDDYFDNHLVYVRNRSVCSMTEVCPHCFADEWGVIWDRTHDKDIGTPVNCAISTPSLDLLQVPDADSPDRYAHILPIIQANSERYRIAKFSYNLFERAWSLRGMENLLADFLEAPAFVHDLLDTITEFNLRVMTNLRDFPIDAVQFGDDWGGQHGLLISPSCWRTFIKPHVRRMCQQAHRQGYDVFIHSCGDISAILDDLIEIGVNVYNPFQPEVIDQQQLLGQYASRLTFYGGLSLQRTLPFGTPADVTAEVEHLQALAQRYGGIILSPSHDMPNDVPLGNILAMRETITGVSTANA